MKLGLLLSLLLVPLMAGAELTIFDVRKSLPMSDDDKIYRDFYVNGGSEAGLSTGMVITVQRRLPLYDSYQNRSAGDLDLKVAKVKIIHVQRGLAVARLHSEFTRENAPLLEDNFILVGDQLDLATATSDKGKKAEGEGEPGQQTDPVASATQVSGSTSSSSYATPSTGTQILINTIELQ